MLDPSPSFRDLGHRLVDLLADHLTGLREAPDDHAVRPPRSPREVLDDWNDDLRQGGVALDALWRRYLRDAHRIQHRRSVGHQVAPPHAATALAQLVRACTSNSAAIFEMGPAATAIEARVVAWMGERLGLPTGHGGVLTSGGSLGNLTALLAMRQIAAEHDVWTDGLGATDRVAVLVGEQTHYCVERALQILGLGAASCVRVPVDRRFRIDVAALPDAMERARAAGRRPIGVVASACSTSTGAIDPLDAIADFCDAHELWLHVDAAHGASLVLSERERPRLRGIERADSVVWDAHKTLLVSSLCTGVLFADGRHADASFAPEVEYLFARCATPAATDPGEPDLDLGRRTLECTKPALGLELYALLASRGEGALGRYLEERVDVVRAFADRVRTSADFELATDPDANIVCFRHLQPGLVGAALDAHQDRLRLALLHRARFYATRTRLRDATWLRCTVLHPETTAHDLDALLAELRSLAESVARPV
ncbi:MAG: aminotransferase class I/II-fold pyridoxal phosphate-dependent enzyme [Planctomycetes bacterium]|nr:aminotransferase class I/II-fold pyridoxal phosphate-dependent enzyme [Planctomycetota bacterium]